MRSLSEKKQRLLLNLTKVSLFIKKPSMKWILRSYDNELMALITCIIAVMVLVLVLITPPPEQLL